MSITLGADATWDNIGHLPGNVQQATYSTQVGNAGIAAPESWLDAHPLVLRYSQLPSGNDPKASVLDVETNAATVEDVPSWLEAARANWHAGTTPGQRWPAIYVNGSNITPVANIIVAAKIATPVPLVLANWSIGEAAAITDVTDASGPFPLVGLQFSDLGGGGEFDWDIYSTAWLANVSRHPAPPSTGPYRHLASGHQSLAQIAAGRNTTEAHLAALSADAYRAELERSPLPAATEWWSANP